MRSRSNMRIAHMLTRLCVKGKTEKNEALTLTITDTRIFHEFFLKKCYSVTHIYWYMSVLNMR